MWWAFCRDSSRRKGNYAAMQAHKHEFAGGVLWQGIHFFLQHYDKVLALWQSTMTKVNYYKVKFDQDSFCTLQSWLAIMLQKLSWKILHYDKVTSHKTVTQPFQCVILPTLHYGKFSFPLLYRGWLLPLKTNTQFITIT